MNQPTDSEMLNWLQKQLEKKKYTGRCIFRWSSQGRGIRLHETTEEWGQTYTDVRAALWSAMNTEKTDEEFTG